MIYVDACVYMKGYFGKRLKMNLVFCGGVRTSAKMMKVEFVPIEDEAWGELPGRQECCCIYRRSTYG